MARTCDVWCQETLPCGLTLLHHQELDCLYALLQCITVIMPTVVMPEVCLLAGAWLPVTSQGAVGDQCTSSRFRLPAELYPSGFALKHMLDATVSSMRTYSQ